ncbi:hypothetical protein [Abyssalbus ytuae]|uniref:Uncharacterized protein n=1 Tax=Abyssalbus ytuae TaxID=2926907 RepID=A0A9E6ZMI7_9FLAO|nr:hypothetical protein [Abyssalbus ytuae]UOB18584.1 hypothetical protein MQE35_04670 [Abyssalbus ytuae]
MVGVKIYTTTTGGGGTADISPYAVINGWLVRKRTEIDNNDTLSLQIGDYVVDGIITLNGNQHQFSGEYTGGDILDIENYNTPGDIKLINQEVNEGPF